VVAGHPLASKAGAEVLARGGNAMDAAIAMAAVLAVVRPHMCGLGGDAFALYLEAATGKVHALNGSGRAGSLATPQYFSAGGERPARRSPALHVTVPGAVAGYLDAHERFGSVTFSDLLAPAIRFAREGFPVSEYLARELAQGREALPPETNIPCFASGETTPAGSLIRNPELAETLEAIALEGRRSFYEGRTGEILSSFLQSLGGHILPDDLAAHESTWVEPLRADHFGLDFFVLPPNSQGLAFLQQIEMARWAGIPELEPGSSDYLHTLIEIKKLAFADRDRWVGDPAFFDVPVSRLLDPEYLQGRARQVRPDRAIAETPSGFGNAPAPFRPPAAPGGDTVFLTAVDSRGNAVSWIQSIFSPFGSGLFEPTTGVLFHNRGASFNLVEGHPNRVAPGKRPFHTLSPLMVLRGENLGFTLGTPGADGQTQTLLQVVLNHLAFGMDPQKAIDAPRFRSAHGLEVAVETRFPEGASDGLRARGHEVREVGPWASVMGGAQMILSDPGRGTLTAAADPRREARAEVL
jgi:gamma-glutamyltranspeptidase/glutathione hydrolase